ncbi:hypothetical protein RO3G_07015 [Lichtheimia corymbifera JMRC:FSU:9682]|uniref:BHLH domain-containing protein n=1 Tax=Lichtheimia corymbifera JMRC:FSU:9682 TaxID=1263082 RepID=A0A068S6K4_9FUNG|nr:hypothetical protein RO3G_07015 [Lichtheimia corymbifera JMRC:FSU:9682]
MAQPQQQFITQAYPAFDPAAPIYYSSMVSPVASPPTPAQRHHHHPYPHMNHYSQHMHIFPQQHEEQARRLQQLQQHAMFQQQQAIYHQQLMAYQQHYQIDSPTSPGKRMQTKAERRAEHNAIERARRENLNTKFQQLAHSLPNLQNDRRPSKGTIIERTLDFVRSTMQKEERFLTEIRKLREEHDDLMQQLYPGHKRTDTSEKGDENDDLKLELNQPTSTTSSPNVPGSSLTSSSCPSLELPLDDTSPNLPPTTGLDVTNNRLFDTYGVDITPLNDVMFGHYPEHNQATTTGTTATNDSDDDHSSAHPDELDLTNTNTFATNNTLDYMGKVTPSPISVSSSDYVFKVDTTRPITGASNNATQH